MVILRAWHRQHEGESPITFDDALQLLKELESTTETVEEEAKIPPPWGTSKERHEGQGSTKGRHEHGMGLPRAWQRQHEGESPITRDDALQLVKELESTVRVECVAKIPPPWETSRESHAGKGSTGRRHEHWVVFPGSRQRRDEGGAVE